MNEAPRLAEMLRAIATGSAVDWNTVDATPSDESTSSLIEELRVLSRIAEVHGTARRDAVAGSADAEPLSSWGSLAILECVGRGSYGDVYRAWDTRLDREVALKLLRRRAAPEASPVIEEGRLLARVRHPNAITVYGADDIDGCAGIWMEFIEGRTLEEELQARGPLPAAEVAALGIDICRALDAVHKAGVVHRDIKAQNVMREGTGRIVLMDFGSGLSDESGEPVIGGTPLYLAPEVLAGGQATIRSDIYAVGVLLYHLLTGRYPVEGSTLAEVRACHGHRRPAARREMQPGIPRRLCIAVERAIAFDPAVRFESAAAFEAALSRAMTQRRRTTWLVATAATVVLASAVGVAFWRSKRAAETSFMFKPHDLVLVTSFVNSTAERALDNVLEYAVERELSNSTHVGVAPRIRVEDTLRLVNKQVDVRLDAALGRAICQRDGGIPALITGRVDKREAGYIVSAEILACSDDRRVATVTEEARDVQALSGAIRRVASRLREDLGEDHTAIHHSSQQLENGTPSLRALRLYSESLNLGTREEWLGALDRARQAVAADETFASAHIWLAWSMQRNEMPRETYVPIADKAVKLAATAMDWERQWILGSYFEMTGDEERALAAYRAFAELRPDHFWGIRNLAQLLYRRRNYQEKEKALPYAIRWADLRPHDSTSNLTAATNILNAAPGDLASVKPYVMRLGELGEGPLKAWALFFDAAEHLANRDIAGVEAAVNRNLAAIEAIDKYPAMTRDAVRGKAIRYFLTLGRGRQARALVEQLEDRVFYYPFYRTIVALSVGDTAAARTSALQVPYNNYFIVTGSLLVRLGMVREAETFLKLAPPGVGAGRDFMLQGTVAAARGELDAAIPVLEQMAAKRWPGNHARTQADLAAIWMRRGDRQRAIEALRQSWDLDPRLDADVDGPYGHDWMPNAFRLAALYRYAGRRHEDAVPIEGDLRRLLSTADPDFPLYVKVKRLDLGWFPGVTDP